MFRQTSFFYFGLILVLLLACNTCLWAAPLAWVANHGDGTVSAMDVKTHKQVHLVKIGRAAFALAADHAGTRIYASQFDSGKISVIDKRKGTLLKKLSVGSAPGALMIDPADKFLFALDWKKNKLIRFDLETEKITGQVAVGTRPSALLMSQDGRRIYVASEVDEVSVVELSNFTVKSHLQGTAASQSLAMDVGNDRLFLVNARSHQLQVFDLLTGRIQLSMPLGEAPRSVKITADGKLLLVADALGGVAIVDVDPFAVRTVVQVGKGATRIALGNDERSVYVVNRDSDALSIVDLRAAKVIDGIRVGSSPRAILLTK